MSADTGIPLVVTNDSHYLTHDDVRAHEILLCIQTGKTMSDPNRMRFSTPDFYVKTRAEMMTLFGEVEHALDRTYDISQRCHVKLEQVKDPFPRFEVPPGQTRRWTAFSPTSRAKVLKSAGRVWKRCISKGRTKARCSTGEYLERLELEIQMIQQMKFSGYFLIVWDFIRFCQTKRHSRWAGPWLRRRQLSELRHGDHRHRSTRIRSSL